MDILKTLSVAVLLSTFASAAVADLDFHPLPMMTAPVMVEDSKLESLQPKVVPKEKHEIHGDLGLSTFPLEVKPEAPKGGAWKASGLYDGLPKLTGG